MRLVLSLLALPLLINPAHSQLLPLDHVAAGTPNSAVGRVHPGGGHCTGALVARNLAITAAHCLYNRRTGRWLLPGSIHFLLGYDRGSYGFHTRVKDYETGGFDPNRVEETLGKDWALLRLEEKAPSEYAALSPIRGTFPSDGLFRAAGYATPRRYALSTTGECTALMLEGLLISECPSSDGMSGAPLIDQASGRLIGIQVARMNRNGHDMMIAVPATVWTATGVGD